MKKGECSLNKQNEIILFENQGVKLEVNVKDETVWLNVKQMAELFGREKFNIRRHIINVFKEKGLMKTNNVQNLHVDGVIFRKWVNKVLKEVSVVAKFATGPNKMHYAPLI